MSKKFDFGGYATRNDLLCADGRTIRKDAFKDCDGMTVPLVWGHQHDNPISVLGHALLENRDDGVYAYCAFNDTDGGQIAKELVNHGDINAMSIYANKLKQKGKDVLHGIIREVSLVMAGANPGAFIDSLSIEHADDEDAEFEAIIYTDGTLELAHEDDSDEKKPEEKKSDDDESAEDVFNTLNEKQKLLFYILLAELTGSGAKDGKDEKEPKKEGEAEMIKHNVFENDTPQNTLTHEDMQTIFKDAKQLGSLREAVLQHQENGLLKHAIDTTDMDVPTGTPKTYGINGVEFLFPDARTVGEYPIAIKRDTTWVTRFMQGTRHTPFSRIKSIFANLTEDDARARGYLKGKMKKDEVFSLLKRATTPQTVYKKQRMDRDDITDITDFNVVAYLRSEMRGMLDEEIARAALIGDGRLNSSDDKISEDHIRPIVNDKPLFTIQTTVTTGSSDEETARNMITAAVKARKDYKGSGNPVLFTTEDYLTDLLLIEDTTHRRIYKSEAEVATAMRVSEIITVPVMENFQLANGNDLMGIIVNLSDYTFGADKGGSVNMFDDFDIDYNQEKYLIETRVSGALLRPYSAIVLSKAHSESAAG